MQQLQLGAQGVPASMPALKAAAGVAEGALLERQALKRQRINQQQQQQLQLAGQDVSMAAATDIGQQPGGGSANAAAATGQDGPALGQQQQQQQGDATPGGQSSAAAGDAAAATAAAPGDAIGNCSAATAAALLAESGDDLAFDLDFLESMLQVGMTVWYLCCAVCCCGGTPGLHVAYSMLQRESAHKSAHNELSMSCDVSAVGTGRHFQPNFHATHNTCALQHSAASK
jgi:hypothetical protein